MAEQLPFAGMDDADSAAISPSSSAQQPAQGGPSTAAVQIDDDDDDDKDQVANAVAAVTTTTTSKKRTLTEIGQDDDDDDDDDKERSEGEPVAADAGGSARDDDDEEEDDDDDDEEDEDDSRPDKPRKKKRRRRGGNQFLDIEADVDEDEDEEEDEQEDGFVAGNDDFIVKARDQRPGGAEAGDDDLGDMVDGDVEDGDASHRLLDRRRNAKRDKEAAELAASFEERYRRQNYAADGVEDWAPKALLMPGVNDPSIWGVRCKAGRERELVLSLSRKAHALAMAENTQPLKIISAFQRDSIKGYLYIEARSEDHVRRAIEGLIGVYANSPNGVFLVDIEEMPDLLKTKQKKVELTPGMWVRIKRGKYAGDLAQIIDMGENGEEVTLKYIPRIDLTPKDEGSQQVGSDGKKRKKPAATPLAFRPPQRFFNAEEISKVYGSKEVPRPRGGVYTFKNESFKDGYIEKDIRLNGITVEDVSPTIDELTRFLGDSSMRGDGAGAGGDLGADLTNMADAARKNAKTILQPGDAVEIFEGDQKGMYGTVDSIANEVVQITPHADLDLEGTKVEVQARSVRKRFKEGDHVKVMAGTNADETGLVVKVQDDIVTFLSDLSMQEVNVFAKDVREAAEVGSGVNVIGQYELHDLVQLDPQTTGVIFKIERDLFRILDQSGTVRNLKPNQISNKVFSRNSVAIDQDGYDIRPGDEMKETGGNAREGRTGRILHVYRSMFAFLHNRDYAEHGGVFVAYARSLTSTAPKGHKIRAGTGMNPDRGGMAPPPVPLQNSAGVGGRPDGRINRKVSVTKGVYKGYIGRVKDVSNGQARVELHTNNKTITMSVASLKELKDDGSLVALMERPQGAGGYGGRGAFSRESSTFSTAANMAPLGRPGSNMGMGMGMGMQGGMGGGGMPNYAGGRTPAPMYNGGRTPAPNYSGGRTPAPAGMGNATPFGAGGAFDPSGRTPAHPGVGGGAFAPGSRTPAYPGTTPAYASTSAFNPSSRTPAHPSMMAGGATPVDPRLRGNDGGRTPFDPRAGGRTPAYGAKSGSYGQAAATPAATAPTPAAAPMQDDDETWGAPTPAPSKSHDYGGPQAKTPYEAPTPYGGAPTPAAPTPVPYNSGPYGAPTPAPYGAAPTPGAYGSGPTPGYSAVATPGGYGAYQTPGTYAGAATAAAQPLEYQERNHEKEALPSDWVVEGLRVIFVKSSFQGGRVDGQYAVVQAHKLGLSTVKLDSNQEVVEAVPTASLTPFPPTRPGEVCMVLAGEFRGHKVTTQSRDDSSWMVQTSEGGSSFLDQSILALMAPA